MTASKDTPQPMSLSFQLAVEDGWPPVAEECLPFEKVNERYRVLASPLFVQDLSVDDVIEVEVDDENRVWAWKHIHRSKRTTIWLLRMKTPNLIENVLARLRNLGCNTARFKAGGVYAIDVPESVSIDDVDVVLSHLDSTAVAIAFPSMRHTDQ